MTVPSTMRAWQIQKPLKGKIEDILILNPTAPAPSSSSLNSGQILVKVLSASINPIDYKAPENGIAKHAAPGLDFCGKVIAIHSSIASTWTGGPFEEGQFVFGSLKKAQKFGSLGEYMIVSQSECGPVPNGVEVDDAAALGTAAGSALNSFPTHLFKTGNAVFINGGSGGVGTYAVQIARILGASQVTTSCSTANVALCKELGANEVLDYKKVDVIAELRKGGHRYDLVIDNVGTSGLWNHCDDYLHPRGSFIQVAATPNIKGLLPVLWHKLQSLFPGIRTRSFYWFYFVMSKGEHKDYVQLGKWLVEGKLKSIIDERFDFENVPKAFEKLRSGHAHGKIVIHIAKE